MKKIISGKVYDTDTAAQVGCWDNGYTTRDFNCEQETLYRKKTGEFFLHGSGGALTHYASREGDGFGWGDALIPLAYDKAQTWAEEHLSGDDYERIFGSINDTDDDVQLACMISAAAAQKLSTLSSTLGKTKREIVQSAIEAYNAD